MELNCEYASGKGGESYIVGDNCTKQPLAA